MNGETCIACHVTKRERRVGRERTRGEREIVAGRICDGVTHTSKHLLFKLTCGYLSTTEIWLLYMSDN